MKALAAMRWSLLSVASCVLLHFSFAGLTSQGAAANPEPGEKAPSALVEKMYGIALLEFKTDHPVQEARLLVDGQVVASEPFPGNKENGLKVGAVVSWKEKYQTQNKDKRATIFLEAPQYRTFLQTYFRPNMDARVRPTEHYGPGQDLRLAGDNWTEVYRYSESFPGGKTALRDIKVEVR